VRRIRRAALPITDDGRFAARPQSEVERSRYL